MMKRWNRRPSDREEAQGMVEFALVLPLLLLLMFGLIEAGRLLFVYSMVSASSREGARYGSASGDVGDFTPHYEDCDGIRAAAQRIGRFAGVADGDIQIAYDEGPGTSNYGTCDSSLNISKQRVELGDRVKVSVSNVFQPILPLVNLPPIDVSSSTVRTILKDVKIEGTPRPPVASDPTVTFVPLQISVDEDTAGTVSIALQLSHPTSDDVIVNFSLSGTATPGASEDYVLLTSSPVVIPAGSTNASIQITVNDDGWYEGDEAVVITMGSVANAIPDPSPNVHTMTIMDDEPPPNVFFAQAGATYDEGTTPYSIQVVVDTPADVEIQVPYSVDDANSDASTPDDYNLGGDNPLVIPARSSSASIPLNIVDDALDEEDETITINLDPPTLGNLGSPSQHVAVIEDNDEPPDISFALSEQYVAEPSDDGDTKTISVDVVLSAPSGREVTVPISISGTATRGADYVIPSSTANPIQMSIDPGNTSETIVVNVLGDEVDINDEDETIIFTMGTPVNAGLVSPAVHTVTITDRTVYFSSASSTYDESAGTVNVDLEISSEPLAGFPVTVNLIVGGTAKGNGEDFTLLSSLAVEFTAGGPTSKTIQFTLINDVLYEIDETVVISIDSVTSAAPAQPSEHILTIQDNDGNNMPDVYFTFVPSVNPRTVVEPDGVGESIEIPIELAISTEAGVDVSVAVNLSGTALKGTDYTTIPENLNFNFPAGNTSPQSIKFQIYGDELDEGDVNDIETAIATIGMVTNANVGSPSSYELKIEDTDSLPSVSFGSATQIATEAVGRMSVSVQLDTISGRDVQVPLLISGTASENEDYAITPNPVVIPAGETSALIYIDVVDDEIYESEETVVIDMGTLQYASRGNPSTHTARITDNETVVCPGVYTLGGIEINEQDMKITTSLTNNSGTDVEIIGFSMNWSNPSADLASIQLGTNIIWQATTPVNPPAFVTGGWTGASRTVVGPSTSTLIFQFTGSNLRTLDYLYVSLDNGCTPSY